MANHDPSDSSSSLPAVESHGVMGIDEFTSLFWDRIQQWVIHTTAPATG